MDDLVFCLVVMAARSTLLSLAFHAGPRRSTRASRIRRGVLNDSDATVGNHPRLNQTLTNGGLYLPGASDLAALSRKCAFLHTFSCGTARGACQTKRCARAGPTDRWLHTSGFVKHGLAWIETPTSGARSLPMSRRLRPILEELPTSCDLTHLTFVGMADAAALLARASPA